MKLLMMLYLDFILNYWSMIISRLRNFYTWLLLRDTFAAKLGCTMKRVNNAATVSRNASHRSAYQSFLVNLLLLYFDSLSLFCGMRSLFISLFRHSLYFVDNLFGCAVCSFFKLPFIFLSVLIRFLHSSII